MSLRRTLFIIAWVACGLVAWSALANAVGFTLMYLVNERQVKVPEWTLSWLNIAGVVGALVVPAASAVLGMRGKLPGTRGQTDVASRGFPMDV
jgi:hypothetical protein